MEHCLCSRYRARSWRIWKKCDTWCLVYHGEKERNLKSVPQACLVLSGEIQSFSHVHLWPTKEEGLWWILHQSSPDCQWDLTCKKPLFLRIYKSPEKKLLIVFYYSGLTVRRNPLFLNSTTFCWYVTHTQKQKQKRNKHNIKDSPHITDEGNKRGRKEHWRN